MKFKELIYDKDSEAAKLKGETHLPKIEAPEKAKKDEPVSIKVKVGPHPNELTHSIKKIELWFYEKDRPFNPIHLATIELEPGYGEPEIEIKAKLKKSGKIYALAYCNLHGYWENEKDIEIE